MTKNKRNLITIAAALAASILGCSGELSNNAAPVELVVTNTQDLFTLDISPNDDADCDSPIGTINMQVIAKPGTTTGDFSTVRVNRYRVSYQRVDGGTLVPASFVRSIDTLITAGGSANLNNFVIFESDAILRAPFAALLPQNGGRDPETGRTVIKMDVIVELFGETLGGDRVYDATRFQLDFCYACGGCR